MLLQSKKGFTLIELMVVIAIMGILASIVIAGLSSAKAGSRDAKRISDIKNIQLALATYYIDTGKYPNSNITNITTAGNIVKELTPTYLSKMPNDPVTNAAYFYVSYTTGSGNCVTVPPTRYHLGTALEGSAVPADNVDYGAAPSGFNACGTLAAGSDFPGQSLDCVNSGSSPDKCYDVINN